MSDGGEERGAGAVAVPMGTSIGPVEGRMIVVGSAVLGLAVAAGEVE